jgi:Cu-Zn family superoxide dismutase
VAPRVSTENLKGRALVIHSHGDNYSDDPEPLGGGRARVGCGVVSE